MVLKALVSSLIAGGVIGLAIDLVTAAYGATQTAQAVLGGAA